jgi:hypothetical protein
MCSGLLGVEKDSQRAEDVMHIPRVNVAAADALILTKLFQGSVCLLTPDVLLCIVLPCIRRSLRWDRVAPICLQLPDGQWQVFAHKALNIWFSKPAALLRTVLFFCAADAVCAWLRAQQRLQLSNWLWQVLPYQTSAQAG